MLVLAPVMCILSGITVSASLSTYMKYLEGTGSALTSSGAGDQPVSHHGGGGGGKKSGRHHGKQSAANQQDGSQRELVATVFVSMLTFFLVRRTKLFSRASPWKQL